MEQYMELIIYLDLIIIYIIARLFQGKKPQTDNEPQSEQPQREEKPQTPFDDFLRELRGEEEANKPSREVESQPEETYEHPFSDQKASRKEEPTSSQTWQQKREPQREKREPIKGTLEEKWGPVERTLTNENQPTSQANQQPSYESYEYERGKHEKPFYNKARVYRELLRNRQSARQSIVISEILKPKHF